MCAFKAVLILWWKSKVWAKWDEICCNYNRLWQKSEDIDEYDDPCSFSIGSSSCSSSDDTFTTTLKSLLWFLSLFLQIDHLRLSENECICYCDCLMHWTLSRIDCISHLTQKFIVEVEEWFGAGRECPQSSNTVAKQIILCFVLCMIDIECINVRIFSSILSICSLAVGKFDSICFENPCCAAVYHQSLCYKWHIPSQFRHEDQIDGCKTCNMRQRIAVRQDLFWW